jgi:hypothetical protein
MSSTAASRRAAFVLALAVAAPAACSSILDFDALTNGGGAGGTGGGAGGTAGSGGVGGTGGTGGMASCDKGPCPMWDVACHSVFVAEDEQHAYVTRYQNSAGHPPGLYRIDLSLGAGQPGERLSQGDSAPAVGIAGNASFITFATTDQTGAVFRLTPTDTTPVKVASLGFDDPFGVALGGTLASPLFFWAEDAAVKGVDTAGSLSGEWALTGMEGRYVAVHEGVVYATASGMGCSDPMMAGACLLRLEPGGGVTRMVDGFSNVNGLAVTDLERPIDGMIVPHVIYVTAASAKVAWSSGTSSFDHSDIHEPYPGVKIPGEVALDATHVYWTMRDNADSPGGALYRKALRDIRTGSPETLAGDQKNPNGVALAGSSVYWCSAEGLYRMPR